LQQHTFFAVAFQSSLRPLCLHDERPLFMPGPWK
jgi:hypothetical protein